LDSHESLASNTVLVQDAHVVSRTKINRFSREIAREFRPEKIVLFGSYAYGSPTEDSDVDPLVIMPFDRRKGRKSLEIRERIGADFPLDLIVRTPQFIAQRMKWGDCFTREILTKGRVLYEAVHPRMDSKSRG
jgi:predicted nucleotidyltransferase